MKYLTPDENYWACDIEADGLLKDATKIHCVCVENIVTGEQHAFTDDVSFRTWYNPSFIMVGHNFIAYDAVMLNRFWKMGIKVSQIVDTFVLSQLYNPTYVGGHSLSAWGNRLKFPKLEHNDFSTFTPQMLGYCRNDTALTGRLYRKLSERMVAVGFTEEGCGIEHLSWNIIQNKQRRHGFPFDVKKAEELYATLIHRKQELENEIYKVFPPQYTRVASFARGYKQDGTRTRNFQRHVQQYPELRDRPDGGYDAYDWVYFNLGSPAQRIEKLLEHGWTPSSFTDKGNPKVDEESLLEFAQKSGIPEITAIAKWLVVASRANMVKTWLDSVNPKTGCIHGDLFIASTLRYRHSSPNSANIPAVKHDENKNILYREAGTWAYECRSLWTCGDPDNYRLVGVDAKGIQIRILLNYAYSQEAVDLYLHGDPHVNNAELLGLANKPAAKKFFYTLIMGGAGKRLAADQAQFGTKLTAKQGAEMKAQMIATIPGFKELIKRLEKELEQTGRISLCDGTPILVPSPHMVIPYLLQGIESRIMKKVLIEIDKLIRRNKWDIKQVAFVHDELQFVVTKELVNIFIEKVLTIFEDTGRYFDFKLPIEGDAQVGSTWAEAH